MRYIALLLLCCSAAFSADGADWFSIAGPDAFEPGKPIEYTVIVTDENLNGQQLQLDMHGSKKDGSWGGMVKWGGKARPIVVGEPMKWTLNGVQPKLGLVSIYPNLFVSPDGQWANHTKTGIGPKLTVELKLGFDPDKIYRKSWIRFGTQRLASGQPEPEDGVWRSGMKIEIPIDYYLDQEDAVTATKMKLIGMGPWVDCPDGTYTTKRGHQQYKQSLYQEKKVEVGEHEMVFSYTLPASHSQPGPKLYGDGILWVCEFTNDLGTWPWQIRGGTSFEPDHALVMQGETVANLFTYDQPVRLKLSQHKEWDASKLPYIVRNVKGDEVARGEVTLPGIGASTVIALDIDEPGTFAIYLGDEANPACKHAFARIPDIEALLGDEPSKIGMNWHGSQAKDHHAEIGVKANRMLGMSNARLWLSWQGREPAPGQFKDLDKLSEFTAFMNEQHITPWFVLIGPPSWTITSGGHKGGFYPTNFRDADLQRFITKLTETCKGTFSGWEFLNEITPGNAVSDPVSVYLRFCKVANEASKKVDPSLRNQLAGGLWPRSFRTALLTAGVGKHIDILPVHYANGGAVEEARADLRAVGAEGVSVADNETARGISTWGMPLQEALAITDQSNWIMTQWTDELMAKVDFISCFGSTPDHAGNWSHFWDGWMPRPAAATIAVFVSKMHKAEPVGKFTLGESGGFHLFKGRDGKALIIGSAGKGGEDIELYCGSSELRLVDNQGVVSEQQVADRKSTIHLDGLKQFIEGADLDAVKAYVVPSIVTSSGAQRRSGLSQRPTVTAYAGTKSLLQVAINNVYDDAIKGSIQILQEDGTPFGETRAFSLAAREQTRLDFAVGEVPIGRHAWQAKVTFERDNVPVVYKPFTLNVVDTSMLGNLLKNPGYEEANGDQPAVWSGSHGHLVDSDGRIPGLENKHWAFDDTKNEWAHLGQKVPMDGGGNTMLYTAWVRTEGLPTGSNVYLDRSEGKTINMYNVKIFTTPKDQEQWEVFTAKFQTPKDLTAITCAPVAKGGGKAFFDNMRLTIYEGTDFAAEAHKKTAAITVDGDLSEWDERGHIPLIGRNQLTAIDDAYIFSPTNCAGTIRLRWDEDNLYLAAVVQDDQHQASAIDAKCQDDDGLRLLIHPGNRQPGTEGQAWSLCLTSAKPGGSGKHTVFRDPEHAAGLKDGQLARDSSVYDIAIKRSGGKTIYELRMPLADSNGISAGIGSKIGFSAVLTDRDGGTLGGRLSWGGGIIPAWSPENAGVVTFVE